MHASEAGEDARCQKTRECRCENQAGVQDSGPQRQLFLRVPATKNVECARKELHVGQCPLLLLMQTVNEAVCSYRRFSNS